ncbi:hypothetical protein ACMFMG_004041 [Clarireedia jacksonii]
MKRVRKWLHRSTAEQQAALDQRVLDLKSKPLEVLDGIDQSLVLLQRQLEAAQQDATKAPVMEMPVWEVGFDSLHLKSWSIRRVVRSAAVDTLHYTITMFMTLGRGRKYKDMKPAPIKPSKVLPGQPIIQHVYSLADLNKDAIRALGRPTGSATPGGHTLKSRHLLHSLSISKKTKNTLIAMTQALVVLVMVEVEVFEMILR